MSRTLQDHSCKMSCKILIINCKNLARWYPISPLKDRGEHRTHVSFRLVHKEVFLKYVDRSLSPVSAAQKCPTSLPCYWLPSRWAPSAKHVAKMSCTASVSRSATRTVKWIVLSWWRHTNSCLCHKIFPDDGYIHGIHTYIIKRYKVSEIKYALSVWSTSFSMALSFSVSSTGSLWINF